MKSLFLIGGGGFAREVFWLATSLVEAGHADFELGGCIASDHPGTAAIDMGMHWLGPDEAALNQLDPEKVVLTCAIGNPEIRMNAVVPYQNRGFQFQSLIHPSVALSPYHDLGTGCILCAGSVLTTQIKLGNFVIVNLNTTIGHDTEIGDFVTLSPGCTISGNVRIGSGSELGSNASVLPGLELGPKTILGAGAVATRNLEGSETYAGIPARPLTSANSATLSPTD